MAACRLARSAAGPSLLDGYDPRHSVPLQHSGTYNNNVLTMTAGIAGLSQVYTPEAANALNARGDALRERLNGICQAADVALQVTGLGSMLAFHGQRGPIRTPKDTTKASNDIRALLFYDLLAKGIYMMPKRCFMALSLPLTDADFTVLEEALQEFIETRRSLLV